MLKQLLPTQTHYTAVKGKLQLNASSRRDRKTIYTLSYVQSSYPAARVFMPAETETFTVSASSRRPIALTIVLSAIFHALVILIVVLWLSRESSQTDGGFASVLDLELTASGVDPSLTEYVATAPASIFEPVDTSNVAQDTNPADESSLNETATVAPESVPSEPSSVIEPVPAGDIDFLTSDVASAWQVAMPEQNQDQDGLPEPLAQRFFNSESEPRPANILAENISVIIPPRAITSEEMLALESHIAQWIHEASWQDQQANLMTVEHNGQTFDIEVLMVPASDASSHSHAYLEITTTRDGVQLSSVIQVREKAFSHYAKFVNRWDSDVSLSDDWVQGRFHSNSPINLADRGARPVFNGPVTVAARQSLSRRLRDSVFAGGLETGARPVPLPLEFALPSADSPDQGITVTFFDDDTYIEFQGDGSYLWRTATDESVTQIGDGLVYLIARNNARLNVQGQVRGRVVVYAPRRITISGDLVYARDPREITDSEDFLGLISDGSIEIAESNITGPGDLTIEAAIFARSRFSVRRFRDRAQGVLRIFGSLSAGSVSATEPRYATRVEHDIRLETRRPPSFPTTGQFEMIAWDRQWHTGELTL